MAKCWLTKSGFLRLMKHKKNGKMWTIFIHIFCQILSFFLCFHSIDPRNLLSYINTNFVWNIPGISRVIKSLDKPGFCHHTSSFLHTLFRSKLMKICFYHSISNSFGPGKLRLRVHTKK